MSEKLLRKIFKNLYGKPSWNVHRGYGSFITFEFGKPKLEVLEKLFKPTSRRKYPHRYAHVKGEWHLWIYCCEWVIRQDGRKVGDDTSERKIDRGCSVLGGQHLTKIAVNPKNWQTNFYFDLGGHLQTKPYPKNWRKNFSRHLKCKNEHEPSEMWMLRCSDNKWFLLRDDGKYSHQSGRTPPDKKVWQPFIV
jgi:hypothetical protein